jgi:hypothetical protein
VLKRRSFPFYAPPSQFRSSVMRAHLIFLDQRRSFLHASLIHVFDLSFLRSVDYDKEAAFMPNNQQWHGGVYDVLTRYSAAAAATQIGDFLMMFATRSRLTMGWEIDDNRWWRVVVLFDRYKDRCGGRI